MRYRMQVELSVRTSPEVIRLLQMNRFNVCLYDRLTGSETILNEKFELGKSLDDEYFAIKARYDDIFRPSQKIFQKIETLGAVKKYSFERSE